MARVCQLGAKFKTLNDAGSALRRSFGLLHGMPNSVGVIFLDRLIKVAAPARADGAIQWLGVEAGYTFTEYRRDNDNGDEKWDHSEHWFSRQDEEIEQGEDDEHVGEINFVTVLAEIS